MLAQVGQRPLQSIRDRVQLPCGEAAAGPQLGRTVRAVQEEDSFAPCSLHMDMRGPVVVRIDHHP